MADDDRPPIHVYVVRACRGDSWLPIAICSMAEVAVDMARNDLREDKYSDLPERMRVDYVDVVRAELDRPHGFEFVVFRRLRDKIRDAHPEYAKRFEIEFRP